MTTPAFSPSPRALQRLRYSRSNSQYVMSIYKAMSLPTKGSVEESRLIIEGSLTEMEREPRNVQVEVAEDASGKTRISLHDSRGTFMEAFSSPPESSGAAVEQSEVESRDDQEGDNENAESAEDEAYAALVEARARNMELQDLNNELLSQVSTLEGEVTMLADKLKIE